MKTIPDIGSRARYTGGRFGDQTVTGTVLKVYPSLRSNGSERPFSPAMWRVRFEVDEIPEGWVYGASRRFAPAIRDIEPEGRA
jgi:hypothetical protein